MSNPRKLLAKLGPQSRSGVSVRRRSALVATAPDARRHSPPLTPDWRRKERVIDALRMHLWHGASRQRTLTETRSLRNSSDGGIDVSGDLAMASLPSAKRALAVNIYLFRNCPHFARHSEQAMEYLLTLMLVGKVRKDQGAPWTERLARLPDSGDTIMTRIVAAVMSEFRGGDQCELCVGTGDIGGKACQKCAGRGLAQWSKERRAKAVRVRRDDWNRVWSVPHLALLDALISMDRIGVRAHRHAMAA